jgi:hypothetical protein
MRTTAAIKPRFWSSGSGRKLRGNQPAQVLAVYLMSSPHSTMIGLYYESFVSILHETGLTEEQFRAALPKIGEIAQYDEEAGLVYLPNGAEHQIGETLSIKDNKRKAILAQLRTYGKHPFVTEWIRRYHEQYNLAHDGIALPGQAPPKPLRSPSEAPPKGLSQAPDPRSDPRSDPDPRETGESGEEPPVVADLQTRARLWVRDPFLASHQYPQPEQWSEMTELNELVAKTFGSEPDTLTGLGGDGRLDFRVDAVLKRWAAGTDQARMRETIRGAGLDELIRSKPQLQSLQTIFKDGNAVDKYCRLAKSKQAPSPSKANVERLTPEAAERRRKFRAGEI